MEEYLSLLHSVFEHGFGFGGDVEVLVNDFWKSISVYKIFVIDNN
jgi:hypothetical protein